MARKKEERTGGETGRRRAAESRRGDQGEGMRAPGRSGTGQMSPERAADGSDDRVTGRGGRSESGVRGTPRGRDLRRDLREFASARPQGWGHDDWLNFLESLKERGHNINDREAIGVALERERLALRLEQVRGVGPQRRQALVERFGNVWSLRNADSREIAAAAGMPVSLAEQVKASVF